MKTVADVMTRAVRTLTPQSSVVQAAQAMDELNVGVIPVCEGERLVGIVTDRDIVIRGVSRAGELGAMKLADVMSNHVHCARETDEVEHALGEMAKAQIRRLPVVDGNQRLVGIVSLGDIATKGSEDDAEVAESLSDISSPAEPERGGGQRQSQRQH